MVHHGTNPIRQRRSRAVLPCWRAQSPQQLTISVYETLGPGGTEAQAFLAGILARATVAGQTRTYAPSLASRASLARTGIPFPARAGVTNQRFSVGQPGGAPILFVKRQQPGEPVFGTARPG